MPKTRELRPSILLTGFGPFPGVAQNVSAGFVEALAAISAKRFPKRRVIAQVLPTEWTAASEQVAGLCETLTPVLVLHFGVTKQAKGFCIEAQAQNIQARLPDAAGKLPDCGDVCSGGPAAMPVSIPALAIVTRLQHLNVPATLSDNAGTYLCNSVLYQSLTLAAQNPNSMQAGFIHMPTGYSPAHFDFDTALKGGLEIIRVCLGLPCLAQRLRDQQMPSAD